jgi:hypothetical protein
MIYGIKENPPCITPSAEGEKRDLKIMEVLHYHLWYDVHLFKANDS